MDVGSVIRHVIQDGNTSMRRVSVELGHSPTHLGSYLAHGRKPTVGMLARICEITGHELIVRNVKDKTEVKIDPPED